MRESLASRLKVLTGLLTRLHVMQGADNSQAAICKFIGKGGKVDRESFYKRLASTPVSDLPSSILPLTITEESSEGVLLYTDP